LVGSNKSWSIFKPSFQAPVGYPTKTFSLLKSNDIKKESTPLVPVLGVMTKVSNFTPRLSRDAAPEDTSTIDVVPTF